MNINTTNFINWLKQFKDEDNRFGDLIRDIEDDYEFPKELRLYTFDDLKRYFEIKGACSNCLKTLEDAIQLFSNECNKSN